LWIGGVSLAVFCPFKTYSWHDATSSLLGPANVGSGSTGTPTRELLHCQWVFSFGLLSYATGRWPHNPRLSSTTYPKWLGNIASSLCPAYLVVDCPNIN
jgi:hypothetical protein